MSKRSRSGKVERSSVLSSPAATAQRPILALLWPASAVAVTAAFALRRLDDFDTWWHLAAGRWIVTHGSVPSTDTLSFTVPENAWINLQWLYEVLLYGLYSVGGADLLVIASVLCFSASAGMTAVAARRGLGGLGIGVLMLWAAMTANERFLIRPEMATFVLLPTVQWLVAGARDRDPRRLWWLVPAMMAWVNLHSLFILGAAVIAAGMASSLAAQWLPLPAGWREDAELSPDSRRTLIMAGSAALLATLCNPYFLRGVAFPFELVSRIDGSNGVFLAIGEFRPPFSGYFPTLALGSYQVYFGFSIVVVGLALLVRALAAPRRDHAGPSIDIGSVAVFAALAYLSTLARRNVGVFVIGAVPVVAAALSVLLPSLLQRIPARVRAGSAVAARGLFLGCCALIVAYVASNGWYARTNETHEFGLGTFEVNFPIHAAEFMREQSIPGPMFNDLTSGGYLAWDDPTGGGVYIDGRLEVYDAPFFSHYMDTLSDQRRWFAEAEKLDIQSVVLFHRWGNRHRLIRTLAQHADWMLVYVDEAVVVFVRVRGNEEVVQRALVAGTANSARTEARLQSVSPGWGWPMQKTIALQSYGQILAVLGYGDAALGVYQQLLELRLSPLAEGAIRRAVAGMLYRRGQVEGARLQLEKALEVEPGDADTAAMLERVRASHGS